MIILALADIHGDVSKIEKISSELAEADIVLLVGDITNFGRKKEAQRVVELIKEKASRVLAVSGNCDYPEVDDYLREENINLHGRNFIYNGIGFVGVGGSLPCPGMTPNEISEEDFERYLNEALSDLPPDMLTILVSHHPPFQTSTDALESGLHVGSKTVRLFIEKYKPLVCFTGHIHEGSGIDTMGETKIINPGPLYDGHYAYVKLGTDIEVIDIKNIS